VHARAGAEVTVTTSACGENGSRVPASCEISSGGRASREKRGGSVVGQGAAQRCDPRVQRGRGHGQRRWSGRRGRIRGGGKRRGKEDDMRAPDVGEKGKTGEGARVGPGGLRA
jgi:hypothetical protein